MGHDICYYPRGKPVTTNGDLSLEETETVFQISGNWSHETFQKYFHATEIDGKTGPEVIEILLGALSKLHKDLIYPGCTRVLNRYGITLPDYYGGGKKFTVDNDFECNCLLERFASIIQAFLNKMYEIAADNGRFVTTIFYDNY